MSNYFTGAQIIDLKIDSATGAALVQSVLNDAAEFRKKMERRQAAFFFSNEYKISVFDFRVALGARLEEYLGRTGLACHSYDMRGDIILKRQNYDTLPARLAIDRGDFGVAIIGAFGNAKVGQQGVAVSTGWGSTVTAGDHGCAFARNDDSTAIAGSGGFAYSEDCGESIAGDRGFAFAFSRGTATAGEAGLSVADCCDVGRDGIALGRQRARAGAGGIAFASEGHASAGDAGFAAGYSATAGERGVAVARSGDAVAGDYGIAQGGDCAQAVSGKGGKSEAGNDSVAIAGDFGIARTGNRGRSAAGDCGIAEAGQRGYASAGIGGMAKVGPGGDLFIRNPDGAYASAYAPVIYSNGDIEGQPPGVSVSDMNKDEGCDFPNYVLPDTFYVLDESGRFQVADEREMRAVFKKMRRQSRND